MKKKQPVNEQNTNLNPGKARNIKLNSSQNKKKEDDEYIISGTGNRLDNILKVDRG